MAHPSPLIAQDIGAYLQAHQDKSLLRFITCGSVDDGKSTLIGRMLYESHMVFEDHLAALEVDSRQVGTQGGDLDFALLVDGLGAEREQGITIDVAYRFFSTEKRKFIVADTPGHEQYTRNMVTGASTADLAVILVDARRGVLTQTRRHSYLVHLLGIRKVVVAVNKLDLIDYSEDVFGRIEQDYRAFAEQLGIRNVVCIPVSALRGDNVVSRSDHMPWYDGPTLMDHLEQVEVDEQQQGGPFRMPVQWVNRPSPDFRGFSGTVVGGAVAVGEPVLVLPSGTRTEVARVVTMDGDVGRAVAGQSVTLVLEDEVDCSRGDVLCDERSPAGAADAFQAHVVWMDEQEMLPGRSYLMKIGTRTVNVTLDRPKYQINVNTLEHVAHPTLHLNEIGVCNLHVDRSVVYDPYDENRDMGGFIIIDRLSNNTVAAGLIDFALRRSENVQWQPLSVDKPARAGIKAHAPCVVWFTGLPGAGKSTIANLVERRLNAQAVHTYLLDGDNIRRGLSKDLGFTDADRIENVRRVGEVSRLMVDAGLVVLVSLISPFGAERAMVRSLFEPGEFLEVHVDTSLGVAEGRDPKGLYAKARKGELPNFTGVDSPYERPEEPELRVDTTALSAETAVDHVVDLLTRRGVIGG